MKNLTRISQFIKQHATWIDQTFNNTWRIVTNTLKGQASITENQLTITIPPTTNPRMITIEYKPPQNTITTNGNIYIKAEWNPLNNNNSKNLHRSMAHPTKTNQTNNSTNMDHNTKQKHNNNKNTTNKRPNYNKTRSHNNRIRSKSIVR